MDAPQRPPTPPPLPPQRESQKQTMPKEKPSAYIASLAAAGENFMETSVYVPSTPASYHPIFYFFYGTLTKPETLKHVLDIDQEPVLRPAKVVGYGLSAWGQYPALIDGDTGAEVQGYAYEVQSVEHEYKLAYYETNAYKLRPCMIRFTDGQEPDELVGNTFMYAGDAVALQEGRFDRFLWEMQMGQRLPDKWRSPAVGFMEESEEPLQPEGPDNNAPVDRGKVKGTWRC